MAFQNATYANSNYAYYGSGGGGDASLWSDYPTRNSTIAFNSTGAELRVIPAIPDTDTTLTFNGNQLAYASDIPNLANWAQYPANNNVEVPSPYKIDANSAIITNLSTTNAAIRNGSISSLNVSTLTTNNISANSGNFPSTLLAPNITTSTIKGSTINILVDEGIITTTPSAINLETANGSYGLITMTANPGQLDTLGGLISITSNGGNSIGGENGTVKIIANEGTDVTSGITTGGLITITANSGSALTTATGAISLSAGGVNSYAGYATPIASLAGYNFINGTLGVSLVASLFPNSAFQVPGTCYLYGDTGITLGSDTYGTNFFPYWDGITPPSNLKIAGRTTVSGTAEVSLENVSSINGASYPPVVASASTFTTASISSLVVSSINGSVPYFYNPDLELSTLTMNNTNGNITGPLVNTSTINVSTMTVDSNGYIETPVVAGIAGQSLLLIAPTTQAVALQGSNANGVAVNIDGTVTINNRSTTTGCVFNVSGTSMTFPVNANLSTLGALVNVSSINGTVYPPVNVTFVDLYQIYVAPNGNDTGGNGSQQNPYLTIARALTKRATLSTAIEVTIILSSGTYTESFTLLLNTFLCGISTGEIQQPCNIIGNITLLSTSGGQVGLSGLTLTAPATGAAVTVAGANGTYSIFNCSITGVGSSTILFNQGPTTLTECRITSSNTPSQCIVISSAAVATFRNCTISSQLTNVTTIISCNGTLTMRDCSVTSTNLTSTVLQALLAFGGSANKNLDIINCTFAYANTLTDTVGNKCCLQFNNTSGTFTASMSFCLMICLGAITAVGGQIQCIQDPGAGAVNLTYGQLIAASPAHHISPNITKTAYLAVP